MKPGDLVAYVDRDGLIHDAAVVSVINDGKNPLNALTLRSLDDGVERSNVQHEGERPSNSDIRVEHEHISAGHWRVATDAEKETFAANGTRRAKTAQALAAVDETPLEGEDPADTRRRVAEAKTAITSATEAQEPALLVDETPWPGEAPATTEKRIARAEEVLKSRR